MIDRRNKRHFKEIIESLKIFNSLTDEQFDLIDSKMYEVRFRQGETIFKQGTPMTHIIIITEGLVKIYLEGLINRNLILRFARPLTMIGGPGFSTDFKNHVTTVAVEETEACFIDINLVIELVRKNPDFALGVLQWVNRHTVWNYFKFIELTQKGMHGRIAGALLYLQKEVFNEGKGLIKINRQDLADLTAMSKESAIRILKELKDDNIITVEGNSIILNDLEKLSKINQNG